MLISENLERALRWAATCHQGQTRRVTATPYVQHAFAVAMILDRLDFPEPVVIAGLLHDVVEDTEASLADVRERFGPEVAEIVAQCSEVKLDAEGRKRPWLDRKRDHLRELENASIDARAVILADKYHNLLSILCDLRDGHEVWSSFNAARSSVLWYYRSTIDRCGQGTPALVRLAEECRSRLDEVEAFQAPFEKSSNSTRES